MILTEEERAWLKNRVPHIPDPIPRDWVAGIYGMCRGEKEGIGKVICDKANAILMPEHSGYELTVRPEFQERWKETKDINSKDAYGFAVIRAMELAGKRLDEGGSPEDADAVLCSEGLTAAQASMAVSLLSDAHPRGEELRCWWNIRHQIRDEGEKANKSGGVLNIAVWKVRGR